MGFAEKKSDFWRARYRLPNGRHESVRDESGAVAHFRTKREAERAANEAEAKLRRAGRAPAGRETFGSYASRWYSVQDLAASTMQNYRHHIEEHLLPTFQDMAVVDIRALHVSAWEKRERAAGYAESSIMTWRSTLHLILADAMDEGLCESNPAARRRGRGKRAGRSLHRGPEKTVTDAFGVLCLAERTALLSGRDDEFIGVITLAFTGMRWAEVVGLETQFVRPGEIRVEWQLYELDSGELLRCPPKDDSYRTIYVPGWLGRIVTDQVTRTRRPAPCTCHGLRYAFHGYGPARGEARVPGVKLVDVAARAGVSTGQASTVLNRPDRVPDETRARVEAAVAALGYRRSVPDGDLAAHWRRNNFAGRLFQSAATGWYPAGNGQPTRPVPVLGEPSPGVPVRGRNASARADACWVPITSGMSPHSLRHVYKTLMDELGIPSKLKDAQMGHSDGSIQARYSHVTDPMVGRLLDGVTEVWHAALDARLAVAPGSPVPVLDRLLRDRPSVARA